MSALDQMRSLHRESLTWVKDIWGFVYWDMVQFFRYKLIVVSTMLTSVSMILAFGMGTGGMPGFDASSPSYFDFIFPGIVAIGIMFSCTYTIGYSFIVDYNRRTIEDVVLSPLSYVGFILARLIGMTAKCSLQFALVLALAAGVFGTQIHEPARLLFAFVETCLFFAGLGIVMATFTNEISFASLANLFLIPLTYFSGVFFPIENFGPFQAVIAALPLSVHVDILREAVSGQAGPHFVTSQILAFLYALLTILGAMHVFKSRVVRR